MRSIHPIVILALWGAVGCKSDGPGDDTDNPDDTDVVDTDDTDVIDTDVVDTDDTDVKDTDDTDVVDTDVTDTDVGVPLIADILSDTLYVDCMPGIPPDPIHGDFTVHYENPGAVAERAVIQSATLTMTKAPLTSGTWSFDVTPAGSGSVAAGASRDVTHNKVAGSGAGSAGGGCTYCGGTWTLDVTWQSGGTTVTDSLDAGTVDCVY